MKRSPLPRPTLEQVREYERKQREKALERERANPKRRKPLARRGRKAKREQAVWELCRAAVIARASGECEMPRDGRPACLEGRHAGSDVHHVHPEDRDAGLHDPARCFLLCRAAHAWTHENPARAKVLGLLRPDTVDRPKPRG